jgi:hypothetical protein
LFITGSQDRDLLLVTKFIDNSESSKYASESAQVVFSAPFSSKLC